MRTARAGRQRYTEYAPARRRASKAGTESWAIFWVARAALFFTAFFFASCASLGGVRQVASIDSVPRGLEVRDVDKPDEVLGTTPFFVRTGRERNKALEVVRPEGRGLARFRFQCGFRWTSTLLGNSPLAIVGLFTTPLGGALAYSLGLTTDVLTGAAYQCPDRFLFDPKRGVALNVAQPIPSPQAFITSARTPARAATQPCRRYFVIPPYHPDEVVSRLYEAKWREAFARDLVACDAMVDTNDARSLLTRYNITHERAYEDVNAFSVAQTNIFGYRTNATHLVVLRAVGARIGDSESLQFDWTVYDIHSRTKVDAGSRASTGSVAGAFERSGWAQALSWTFGLIPNSIGFGLGKKSITIGVRGDEGELSDFKDKLNLPVYLANWTLLSVYHPYQYSTWALDWDFQPELISSYFARTMNYTRLDGSRILDYQVDGFSLVGIANLAGLVHTPIGGFSFGIGAGPAFIALADSERFRKSTLRFVTTVQTNYTAFMTEDVFLRAGVVSFGGNDTVNTDLVNVKLESLYSVTLGLFVPEARSWMRALL